MQELITHQKFSWNSYYGILMI